MTHKAPTEIQSGRGSPELPITHVLQVTVITALNSHWLYRVCPLGLCFILGGQRLYKQLPSTPRLMRASTMTLGLEDAEISKMNQNVGRVQLGNLKSS